MSGSGSSGGSMAADSGSTGSRRARADRN
jgi:hypothetical protein